MKSMKETYMEWIVEHLDICGYEVEDIKYLCSEDIEKEYEHLYLVKLRFLGEVVERIVFRHGQCLDMISKNIQVKDMLGSDNIIFPKGDNGKEIKLAERRPIMLQGELTPDTVLFYEDYVLVREHFFHGNHLLQVVGCVRTDSMPALKFGDYGRYKITVLTGVNE